VFYIDVGSINPQDVEPFIEQVGSRFKRKKKVDSETGNEDLKFNVMGVDQDFIIPKRGTNDSSKIETLAGSNTASDITDIDYELNLLFASLGLPKPFLNYSETTGEGKALSSMDIRVAKKVKRMQQAILMELNQVVMIHLYLTGYEGEISNFKLTMNNPSVSEMASKVELDAAVLDLYDKAVTPSQAGIAPMSMTRAKQKYLGMSNQDIILDLEQQRIEKAVAEELENTKDVIPKTGIFDAIDNLYQSINMTANVDVEDEGLGDGEDGGGEKDDTFPSGGGGGDFDMSGFGEGDGNEEETDDLEGEDLDLE
jgi:hypothetical protein